MKDSYKTNEELIIENRLLRKEIEDLKVSNNIGRRVEAELNHERNLYLDLSNAQPAGIYRLRVFANAFLSEDAWQKSKHAPYTLEFFNERFYQILGLQKEQLQNNPGIIQDLVYHEDKADFANANIEANIFRKPFVWEGRFVISDEMKWMHLESIPRPLTDGDMIWTGILYDITDRKLAELEITQKNLELQKLNAEKDKFFSIVAHDLLNPLHSILAFSEMLSEQIQQKNFNKIAMYGDVILKSTQRATDLLKNLMEWSLTITGRTKFKPEHFELPTICDEIIILFSEIATQKKITINKKIPAKLAIYADKAMISATIRNLISNAIKFTKHGGTITVVATSSNSEIIVQVIDTGIGISKDSIEKLFSMSETQPTQGTDKEPGTGLGLILCKEFVGKHEGNIWVESKEGIGSTFYFSIPIIA